MSQINNIFTVQGNNPNDTAISVDIDGFTIIKKLILLDSKDGSKWDLFIHDGELMIEPHEMELKRDYKIKKILD